MEKNWTLSVDQCWLQALQLLMHLVDRLSIFLICNGFSGIQKAVVDQTGSKPPNSNHDLFFGASLTLGSALELLLNPTTQLVIAGCHIKSIFFVTYHNLIKKWFIVITLNKRRQYFKMMIFLIFSQLRPTYQVFSPFRFASDVE